MSAPIQLKETNSVQERIEPKKGDSDYIHLADLIAALKEFATDEPLKILDFGCGDSPYRSLFPNSEYLRADFPGTEVDYEIGARSLVNEKDAQFDLVLSTQVAEHVEDSASYFAESYRLLKPGGRFICTTHGMYPDHSCPYDFQRWTAEGLNRDIAAAGFEITRTLKLTTNGRAIMYLIKRFSGWLDVTGSGSRSLSFRAVRSLLQRRAKDWHKVADRLFPKNRIVEGSDESQVFYIGLLVASIKP